MTTEDVHKQREYAYIRLRKTMKGFVAKRADKWAKIIPKRY